jgi:hypothetical protein
MLLALLLAFDVAVTVDDLPANGPALGEERLQIAQKMISALQQHHVPRVFGFTNAAPLEKEPALAKVLEAWRAAGFAIGNHTWSHLEITHAKLPDFLADIERNEAALAPFGMEKWFRFPGLLEGRSANRHSQITAWLREHGYKKADVSFTIDDASWLPAWEHCTKAGDAKSMEELRQTYVEVAVRFLERARESGRKLAGHEIAQIFNVHLSAPDADRMDSVLAAFEAKGAKWVTLEKARQDPFYEMDPGYFDGSGGTLIERLSRIRNLPKGERFIPEQDWLDDLCR